MSNMLLLINRGSKRNLIFLMKKLLLGFVIITFILSCTNTEKQVSSSLEHQVDSLVQPYLDSAQLAGMAVAVYRGNEKLLLKSYGYSDLEWDVALPVNASFEIGSPVLVSPGIVKVFCSQVLAALIV